MAGRVDFEVSGFGPAPGRKDFVLCTVTVRFDGPIETASFSVLVRM